MIYLLDTHYLIWAITDTKKISKKTKDIIENADNTILVSTISFWEISLKSSMGKLEITGFDCGDLPALCKEMSFGIEPLSANDCCTYDKFTASYHKDPFDRMLIWQAISNNYTLISKDSNIQKYRSIGLKLISDN